MNRFDEEDEAAEFARICAAFEAEGIARPTDVQFREMRIKLRTAEAYVVYEARIESSEFKHETDANKALKKMNDGLEAIRTKTEKMFEGDPAILSERMRRNYTNRLILLRADADKRMKKARRALDDTIEEAGRYHDELIQRNKLKAGN